MLKKHIIAGLTSLIIITQPVYAQKDDFFSSVTLEDLLNLEVTVASANKGLTLRESPGIITLVTAEEIRNMGARDLIDILRLIPGVDFGVDVQGVVGLSMRGNWAHEGKILLLIDGQEMNELAYATTQFGNHYPVDNISRIEMIRGPGSAIYGGFAELGVINIITKGAELQGGEINLLASQTVDAFGRANLSMAYGNKWDEVEIYGNFLVGEGARSDREFSDFYGDSYNMKDNSDLTAQFFNVGLRYKGLLARAIIDQYSIHTRDIFYINAPHDVEMEFTTYSFELKYDWQVTDNFVITPKFVTKTQNPWQSDNKEAADLADFEDVAGQYWEIEVKRDLGSLWFAYDFSEKHNILAGLEYYNDDLKGNTLIGKTPPYSAYNKAFFVQGMFQTDIANITLGARWEDHSHAGDALVPRFGLTKVWDRFHSKFLYSKAFRTPVSRNIGGAFDPSGLDPDPDNVTDEEYEAAQDSSNIEAETTTVYEIETGYRFTENIFLTANFYDIVIEDPIVYFFDINYGHGDSYKNFDEVGTRGLELEAKFKYGWGYINTNFSYYTVSDNKVFQYSIVDTNYEEIEDDQLLGFSPMKFTINSSFEVYEKITLNPSLVYSSKKWGYVAVDDEDNLIADEFDDVLLVNANIAMSNLFGSNFRIAFGVYNALNEDVDFVQPYYDGYHAALPGPSREVFIKLTYE